MMSFAVEDNLLAILRIELYVKAPVHHLSYLHLMR